MKKNISILILLAVVFLLTECDIVEKPYKESLSSEGGTDTISVRKVLLEDFTGHKCGNCPRAHEISQNLSNIYGKKLVVMAVHLSSFAKLDLGNGYVTDYRTPVGQEIDVTFGPFDALGLPKGFVNRKAFDNVHPALDKDDWSSKIASIINTPPDASLKITNQYNESTRQVNIKVEGKFLKTLVGDYKLAVYITEDSCISMQKDYSKTPENIPNYVHRHVLRGAVNSTWGDEINTGGIANAGTTFSKNYTYTLNTAWKPEHCYIVAFINKAGSLVTEKEVIQVEEKKIK
ncbi:MAG: Omp28 family outer membrane lipoprotein [Bacteroidia bacterium]|nr:Omp28 family outer membrane lipoprotein [Bacteroidia bacterium]MDW8348282.1 Omp28 family outer membrane lipoprotein [Bacteroidia bacterium]